MAGNPSTPAPAAAAAVGYTTQTFGDNGLTLGSNIFLVDAPGTVSQAGTGILIHGGQNNSFNDQVQTALADGTGTTFGDGGYFEATMSFTGTPSTDGGWPSFWGGTAPWTGDRVETDIVEWWGVREVAPNGLFWPADGGPPIRQDTIGQPLPANFDPSQPHKYAMLWTTDSLSFYIDDVKGPNVIPLTSPYNILNDQKIVLTLGTGHNNPLTVYSVNVWQAPGAVDVVNGVEVTVSGSQSDPTSPPPPPTPIVTGSGSDTLVLNISEDAYQGNAQFTVSVDGKQLGGTFTATALHASGASQAFTFKGNFGSGQHAVAVNFLNDAWGGTAATDRNLYVNGVSYNGTATGQSATLLGGGPKSFNVTDSQAVPSAVTGSGSDTLVLNISEDAYQGNAQFTVLVDGKQLGGTFTATTLHASGASQGFTFKGDWAVGAHTVAVNFLNDAWGGTATTDRNLYVDGITYNGTATGQSAALLGTGSKSFNVTDSQTAPITVTGSGSDTLVLNISEDAYQGNAQFTVSVDGKQLGGTFTATAPHASGASQGFTFKGNFGSGQHAVAVNFLNDAWGGTAATDRNLYVNSVSYNGKATSQSATLLGTGPATFTVSGGTTPSVSETGDHGSLQKNLSQTGTYTVGGDTFVLGSGNAASVTLGTGVSQIKFIGASSITLTGGAGQAKVTADAGNNKFIAGTGSLDVTGGGGRDAYVFHANSGLLTLKDFSLAKGDTLTVDKALKGAFTQASDGHGGIMLTFGTGAGHGVDIYGMTAALPAANVLWV